MKRLNTIPREDGFRMPGEFEKHSGTYMIWPERPDNWRLGAKPAQHVFALVANTIGKYEPMTMVVSRAQYDNAKNMLADYVRVVEMSNDDSWMRDCGATFVVDDKGNRLAGKSIEFEYGTVESHRSISYFNKEKKAKDTYDVYQVRGDDNGTKLFEFLAINIAGEEIEASHAKCGISGENGLNFITTAHLKPRYEIDNEGDLHKIASEPAMSYFLNDQLLKGYTIRELNHSHPFTDKKTDNDKRFASQIRNILGKKKENIPIFNIYHVKTNTYIRF